MGVLKLTLLGGHEGTCGPGQPFRLPTKKAWAMLAYLALQPGRVFSREHLAGLLWGDRFDEQARKSLRQTLYEIRNALGDDAGEYLHTTRDTASLNSDNTNVDALCLETLIAKGDEDSLTEADRLYRGPLLQGLDIGEEAFEEWLAAERARLHVRACGALERLTALRLERGDVEFAIETGQRLLRLDPLNEEAHRLLIRGLAKAGRRSDALRHFNEMEGLLEKELQVTPETATVALVASVSNGTFAKPAAREALPSRPTPSLGSRWHWRWATIAVLVVGLGTLAAWLHLSKPDFEPAVAAMMAYPLPDNPSIAVLPFENVSDSAEDGLIAKGLTKDIIAALSNVPDLFVIFWTSSLAYEGEPVTVRQVAEDLGVQYVMEGSIQRSGDRLRVTAQLVDAISGRHVWADRFDRKVDDLFALQDELVLRILTALRVNLSFGEGGRPTGRGTTNLKAWLLMIQGTEEGFKYTRESAVRARDFYQKAHELDPNWGIPLAGLAWMHWFEARLGFTDDRDAWIREGIDLAKRAIALDPRERIGYNQLGNLMALTGDYDQAIVLREKAVDLAPNDFFANWGLAGLLNKVGQPERALDLLKRAERLSPRHPDPFLWTLQESQLLAGHYEDAIETAKKSVALQPDRDLPHIFLAAAYSALGRMEDAHYEAARVMRTNPKFTVSSFMSRRVYKDPRTTAWLADLLVKAGLPE